MNKEKFRVQFKLPPESIITSRFNEFAQKQPATLKNDNGEAIVEINKLPAGDACLPIMSEFVTCLVNPDSLCFIAYDYNKTEEIHTEYQHRNGKWSVVEITKHPLSDCLKKTDESQATA